MEDLARIGHVRAMETKLIRTHHTVGFNLGQTAGAIKEWLSGVPDDAVLESVDDGARFDKADDFYQANASLAFVHESGEGREGDE